MHKYLCNRKEWIVGHAHTHRGNGGTFIWKGKGLTVLDVFIRAAAN